MAGHYDPAPQSSHSHQSSFSQDGGSSYSHQTGKLEYGYPSNPENVYGFPQQSASSQPSNLGFASGTFYNDRNTIDEADSSVSWSGPDGTTSRTLGSFSESSHDPFVPGEPTPRLKRLDPSSSGSSSTLWPPNRPFASGERPLSINYLPTKFSARHIPGQYAHRRKVGGGRGAWAEHEHRMPDDDGDLDPDGTDSSVDPARKNKKKPKLVWNRFKWSLFTTNTIFIIYSTGALITLLLVWFNIWSHADVVIVGNTTPLVLSTLAAAFCLLTSLVGYAGIFLNNRAFLAVYTLMCWISFALIVIPGYLTYKNYAFNLEGKINRQWSRNLDEDDRLRIQDSLNCCGYYSPFIEATVSATCYSRSNMVGCKGKYLRFERTVLKTWWTVAFSLVPVQLLIIISALLCSNHVTYRFGKGLTPKRYRLNLDSLAFMMDGYAGEIAAAYGPTVAAEAVNRSSTNLDQLVPSVAFRGRADSTTGSFRSPFETPNLSKTNLNEGHQMERLGKEVDTPPISGGRDDSGWCKDRS
ncbi:Tetraspanin/Peripherin [Phaffia rhodozyma]|uniref:Tetraspanin/Peripherin n=1 Tax=Phaffia rhodozyma TaxID=264483 RepID=A0A0F7SK86_PHARH|nr:Tetraspanin/Peripherin [Phaffia rhodozyma]